METVENLKKYITQVFFTNVFVKKFSEKEYGKLPIFFQGLYHLYHFDLNGKKAILTHVDDDSTLTVAQFEIHLNIINKNYLLPVILNRNIMSALERKRLIEKGVNFIVPFCQLYLPVFFIDIREKFQTPKQNTEKIMPLAQLIILYHILHKKTHIQILSLKQLAELLHYTPMALTKAADDLKRHSLCELKGTKEKSIHFPDNNVEFWEKAFPFLSTPVLKQIYVDNIPDEIILLRTYYTALADYSDLNETKQKHYAVEKNLFYKLNKSNAFLNLNNKEGRFCLEVWKYNPITIAKGLKIKNSVDPLSLYLSLFPSPDERVEAALEDILKDYIW